MNAETETEYLPTQAEIWGVKNAFGQILRHGITHAIQAGWTEQQRAERFVGEPDVQTQTCRAPQRWQPAGGRVSDVFQERGA